MAAKKTMNMANNNKFSQAQGTEDKNNSKTTQVGKTNDDQRAIEKCNQDGRQRNTRESR
jgi:hypothetical protein